MADSTKKCNEAFHDGEVPHSPPNPNLLEISVEVAGHEVLTTQHKNTTVHHFLDFLEPIAQHFGYIEEGSTIRSLKIVEDDIITEIDQDYPLNIVRFYMNENSRLVATVKKSCTLLSTDSCVSREP